VMLAVVVSALFYFGSGGVRAAIHRTSIKQSYAAYRKAAT
jgi:hypothetical protein